MPSPTTSIPSSSAAASGAKSSAESSLANAIKASQWPSLGDLPLALNGKPNPISYPKAAEPFSEKLFKSPTSEYRGCPLAAWNVKLDKGRLFRQIDSFQQMGFGGFFMHVRTGLDTEYMGKEFMELVEACAEYAEGKGMHACLYDEDRWPSGAAGGKVVEQNPAHKAKHLLFTTRPYGTAGPPGNDSPSSARASRSENGHLMGKYIVALDDQGCLRYWACIPGDRLTMNDDELPAEALAFPDRRVWYAYVETNPGSPWFNGQTYVDTLSHDAMASFVRITYETYWKQKGVGSRFGSTVPCMFTDEPQFATKSRLPSPDAAGDVFLPWTGDLLQTYAAAYPSLDLLTELPELIWDLPGGEASAARYRYHDHVCERFVTAFMDQISAWCGDHNLYLTGHMMEEPSLHSQTNALGEAMRCYRNMQMPGIDLLNDWYEYNTAKQATSVARQRGMRGAFTEIYGCTHWYFPFEGHKGCGDWQAALGITFRSPHLAWLGMKGEAKRDYPASLNHQSPWFKEYGSMVEDHFARVAVAMTRGVPVTRVAVVHPVESFWLCFGPDNSPAGNEMGARDHRFAELTDWLLHGLVDFDFISESLLPGQFGTTDTRLTSEGYAGRKLKVGACRYDVVVLPHLRTMRSSTLDILSGFQAAGGRVVVFGQKPSLVDAIAPSASSTTAERLSSLLNRVETVPWHRADILRSLDPQRELDVQVFGGGSHRLLYHMRQDGDERFVFMCNADRNNAVGTVVQLCGIWPRVEIWDTLTGEHRSAPLTFPTREGWTFVPHIFEGCGSVVFRLLPAEKAGNSGGHGSVASLTALSREEVDRVFASEQHLQQVIPRHHLSSTAQIEQHHKKPKVQLDLVGTSLSEPNALVLDYAQHKLLGDENWSVVTEILRIDNQLRERLRLPRKGAAWKQPWAVPASERKPLATLKLRYVFNAYGGDGYEFGSLKLALEDPMDWKLSLNGRDFSVRDKKKPAEWWVDEDIAVVPIPDEIKVVKGRNVLELEGDYGVLTNLERVYLLGSGFEVVFDKGRSDRPVMRALPLPLPSSTMAPTSTATATATTSPTAAMTRTAVTTAVVGKGLRWGDITTQGLPFFVGNVTYTCKFSLGNRARVVLSVPRFSAAVLGVKLLVDDFDGDDDYRGVAAERGPSDASIANAATTTTTETTTALLLRKGHIAYQPRQMVLGEDLGPGKYLVEITAFGNRYNSFGHFHLPEGHWGCWPDQWRTGGDAWTDEYAVKAIGVLEKPELLVEDPVQWDLRPAAARMSAEWVVVGKDEGRA